MRFIWDKKAGKFVPREEYFGDLVSGGIQVIKDIEPSVSPIDGSVIGSRSQLREHNRVHEVVDRREFKGHKFEKQKLDSPKADVIESFKRITGRL